MNLDFPDLTVNTKSVVLQLSSGSLGFCQIPDNVAKIGIIASIAGIRVLLNSVPASASTVVGGSALSSNFATGFPLSASANSYINWINLGGYGIDRVLYFKGITSLPQVTIIYP